MASAGSITRPWYSLADLDIVNDPYTLQIDDANLLDAGTQQWTRITADSPFSSGRVLVHMVKGTPTLGLRIDVTGPDLATVQANVSTLISAVYQVSYNLSLTLDTGSTWTWACEPADVTVGFTHGHVLGRMCPVVLTIPRSPIPVAGPI